MNLPNKLTTFRVILIPFFVFFMLAPNMTGINNYIAVAIFIGKFKTTLQMLMVIVIILNIQMPFFQILGVILTYVALILTVVSLIDYIVKNKDVLKEQN